MGSDEAPPETIELTRFDAAKLGRRDPGQPKRRGPAKADADKPESKKRRRPSEKDAREKEAKEIRARREAREAELAITKKKFERKAEDVQVKGVKNKHVKFALRRESEQHNAAAEQSARAEILLTEREGFLEPEHEMERTYKMTQPDLRAQADVNSQAKAMDLRLENFAPYRIAWTKNGRFLALAGHKGHVTRIDALRLQPQGEVFLNETIRDVTFLHNQSLLAVAQKKHIFIYEESGAEVHRLRSHVRPDRIEFLPYHFLLASVGRGGWLKYQDTSTGELVSEHRTKLGPCSVMAQNRTNAVICLGHGSGVVTMWSPASPKPLVRMFCHDAAISAVTVSHSGNELVTAGRDGKLAIWDVRTFKKIHTYHCPRPARSVDVSQTGLLAVATGYQVQIWRDALRTKQESPYMRHAVPGEEIECARFRPYEDVLGLGTSRGVETILIPGAGLANYDAFEANPFETTKQRRETEVHQLLEKLSPDMIGLDPSAIAKLDNVPIAQQVREQEEARLANAAPAKEKHKMRGKGKIGRRLKAKHKNIVTEEREKRRKALSKEEETRKSNAAARLAGQSEEVPAVFQRFAKSKAANRA